MARLVELEKQALIQILSINTSKNGGNREVVVQYNHSCYKRKILHSVPGCSGRIDSTSSLVPDKTLPFI